MTGASGIRESSRRQRQERRLIRHAGHIAFEARPAFSALDAGGRAADRAGACRSSSSASPIGGRFFSSYTLTLILQQIAIVGILGAAQTLVILTAGIDLSIGVIMVISSVVMGNCAVTYGMPTPIAIAGGFVVGARLRLAQRLSRRPHEAAALHRDARHLEHRHGDELHLFGQRDDPRHRCRRHRRRCCISSAPASSSAAPCFTLGVIAMVLLVLVLWYVLNHTAWGRHVYAVGDDPEAAKLSGIQTKKVLLDRLRARRRHRSASPPGSRSAATARSHRPRPSPTTICRPSRRR